MRTKRFPILSLAVAGFLAACGGGDATGPELEVIEEVEFDPSLGIDLSAMTRLNSGLYIQDLVVGDGAEARTGDLAEVAFKGWLRTGQLFDQGTFSFVVDAGTVITGFNEGIRGMQVGGKRRMIIPPGLAYGASGSGPIPPGAILIFEVDLLSVS